MRRTVPAAIVDRPTAVAGMAKGAVAGMARGAATGMAKGAAAAETIDRVVQRGHHWFAPVFAGVVNT